MTTSIEVVSQMWKQDSAPIHAEYASGKIKAPEYFAKLEVVVAGIKAHLQKHELLKPMDVLVKHGDGVVTVTVDFAGIAVIRDPQDPTRPLFHIPATKKEK